MKRLSPHVASLSLAISISVGMVGIARADSISLSLYGLTNSDLTIYSGGGNYPQHGGLLTVAGVPFTLDTIGPHSDTAVIQSPTNNVPTTYSLPVFLFGVTSAFSLIDTAYGTCGKNVGELEFVGSSSTFTYLLTEGVNVRDHYQGGFCNTLSQPQGKASFGADRLDMQTIVLPAEFATETLESIEFISFGQGRGGSPFLAALTLDPISTVPEPAAWPLGLMAMLAVPLARRRWRQQ